MISRSKFETDPESIIRLFDAAGIRGAKNVAPLGAGEFNGIYAAEADGKAYVIKIAPADPSRTLTYETDMISQEVYYYSLMRDLARIRVPEIYYADFSRTRAPAGYFIMERLPGRQLDQAELDDGEKTVAERRTAEMVARMHAVKGERFGYRQNGLHDDWYLALTSMVENLLRDCRTRGRRTRNGRKLLAWIKRCRSVLEGVESRLINFDVWAPNIICDRENGELRLAWIDPERCLWGDRIADFVCLEFMNMSLDQKRKSLSAYNEVSDEPIAVTDGERIRFAIMLGYLGLIMEVEKYARYTPFHFGWWRNVAACKLLFSHCFGQLSALSGASN